MSLKSDGGSLSALIDPSENIPTTFNTHRGNPLVESQIQSPALVRDWLVAPVKNLNLEDPTTADRLNLSELQAKSEVLGFCISATSSGLPPGDANTLLANQVMGKRKVKVPSKKPQRKNKMSEDENESTSVVVDEVEEPVVPTKPVATGDSTGKKVNNYFLKNVMASVEGDNTPAKKPHQSPVTTGQNKFQSTTLSSSELGKTTDVSLLSSTQSSSQSRPPMETSTPDKIEEPKDKKEEKEEKEADKKTSNFTDLLLSKAKEVRIGKRLIPKMKKKVPDIPVGPTSSDEGEISESEYSRNRSPRSPKTKENYQELMLHLRTTLTKELNSRVENIRREQSKELREIQEHCQSLESENSALKQEILQLKTSVTSLYSEIEVIKQSLLDRPKAETKKVAFEEPKKPSSKKAKSKKTHKTLLDLCLESGSDDSCDDIPTLPTQKKRSRREIVIPAKSAEEIMNLLLEGFDKSVLSSESAQDEGTSSKTESDPPKYVASESEDSQEQDEDISSNGVEIAAAELRSHLEQLIKQYKESHKSEKLSSKRINSMIEVALSHVNDSALNTLMEGKDVRAALKESMVNFFLGKARHI